MIKKEVPYDLIKSNFEHMKISIERCTISKSLYFVTRLNGLPVSNKKSKILLIFSKLTGFINFYLWPVFLLVFTVVK